MFRLDEMVVAIAGTDGDVGGRTRTLFMYGVQTLDICVGSRWIGCSHPIYFLRTVRVVLYDCCRIDLFLDERKEGAVLFHSADSIHSSQTWR